MRGHNGERSFWRTLPGVITAIAALITAMSGLIGGLFAAGIIGRADEDDPTGSGEYQQLVRSICDEDRALELRIKRETERVARGLQSGKFDLTDVATSTLRTLSEGLHDNIALMGQLKALEPPSSLETTHNEAVSLWQRQIDEQRMLFDEARARAGNPLEMLQYMSTYDGSEEQRLGNEVDLRLRKLGGTGCDPTP